MIKRKAMSSSTSSLQKAIQLADPRLSRFDPLSRIIFYDEFGQGYRGWTGLIGNYEGSLDTLLPGFQDLRPPQLSNLAMWDTGTAGAMQGSYALKLATRPKADSMAAAIKRVTWREAGAIQVETYFALKPEATELQISETDVRAFGLMLDLQDDSRRVMPHLRYLNAHDGVQIGQWQYKSKIPSVYDIGGSGKTKSLFHLAPEDWLDVPDGNQLLCYNEIPTKMNWHYLKVHFDLASMRFVSFQCNNRIFDGSALSSIEMPAMRNLWCMLNVVFWIETDMDKRAFLYLDSVLLTGEWDR